MRTIAALNTLLDNPVVTKELRGRMRGSRTYWLLFSYVLLLSLILFFSYLGWWGQRSADQENGDTAAGFTVGRLFFMILFYAQAVMMALITPALTAGAISVEREQRTFELLRGSILRPGAIVWGKLLSSVSFVALLLTSSIPLLSLCFLLGGVSPGEVFFAYVLLIGDAFLFGAIGLCWSAYAANTATATVLSYLTLIAFFVLTLPFAAAAMSWFGGGGPRLGFCAVNPIGAVTGAVLPERYYGWTLPAWVPAILLNGTLTALLVLAAMNRLEDFPSRRAAALRWVTLLFAGLLVFFGDGAVIGATGFGVSSSAQVTAPLIIACLALLLFVPVLVTGDAERDPKWKSPSVRRVFGDARLPSGLPLALLLTALVAGLTLAAPHLGPAQLGGPGQIRQVRLTPAWVGPAPGLAAPATLSGGIGWSAAAMLALMVAGIGGFGFLLSALLNNRWSSLTLLYLSLIFANALPFFSYATLNGTDAALAARNPAVNSLFLCPFVPLAQLADGDSPQPTFGPESAVAGMIGYGDWPLWVGTGAVYLTIGLASYGAGLVALRRRNVPRTPPSPK